MTAIARPGTEPSRRRRATSASMSATAVSRSGDRRGRAGMVAMMRRWSPPGAFDAPPPPTAMHRTGRAGPRCSMRARRSTTTASPISRRAARSMVARRVPASGRSSTGAARSSPTARWGRCSSPMASSSAIRPRPGTSRTRTSSGASSAPISRPVRRSCSPTRSAAIGPGSASADTGTASTTSIGPRRSCSAPRSRPPVATRWSRATSDRPARSSSRSARSPTTRPWTSSASRRRRSSPAAST